MWSLSSSILVATVVLSGAVDLAPGGSFFDDDGSVHEGAIEAIYEAGITVGCSPPDLYCPDRPVTRGEMAAFLRRGLDLPPSSLDPFSDDDESIFERDIAALAATGITRGCGPDSYCPEAPVTRGQMAAFLVRAFDLPVSADDAFADDDESIFEEDINSVAAAGWTSGCGADSFCPRDRLSRAEMASFLARTLGLSFVTPPPRPEISLAFTGDVLIHTSVSNRAARYGSPFDFRPMYSNVRHVIEAADLAICHLEVPLSIDNEPLSSYPTFSAPRQVADAQAYAGYDGCSTASNHSIDRGSGGVSETLAVLEDAGLKAAGTADSAAGAGQATFYEVEGAQVAHLSATWWLNGLSVPADKPWLVQMLDVDDLLAQAAEARVDGADVVVVSVHCCAEYLQTPTQYQRSVARRLVDSPDVDLVVGHHAHVVQPIEYRNGEYIVYGVGNFLSGMVTSLTRDGVIASISFTPRGDRWVSTGVEATPTWVEPGAYRIVPAAAAHSTSWRRTRGILLSEGAPGVSVVR